MIWCLCKLKPERSAFRVTGVTRPPEPTASWKMPGPHSLVVTLVLGTSRAEVKGQEMLIIINVCASTLC